MGCFLYFEIAETNSTTYTKEKLSWVKEYAPDMVIFDLDNFSDMVMKDYALQLLQQNEHSILYVDILAEENLKMIVGYIEKTIASQPSLLLMSNQANTYLEILANQYNSAHVIVNDKTGFAIQLKNFYKI
jgi:hypothetical protein